MQGYTFPLSPCCCRLPTQAFELCDSLNAVGAVLDLLKLLDNKKAPSDSKIATLEALGQVAQAAGEPNSEVK